MTSKNNIRELCGYSLVGCGFAPFKNEQGKKDEWMEELLLCYPFRLRNLICRKERDEISPKIHTNNSEKIDSNWPQNRLIWFLCYVMRLKFKVKDFVGIWMMVFEWIT